VADAALRGFAPHDLARIVSPVVVALGGRGSGPYEAVATALAAQVPNLDIERFAELGHGAPVSRPDLLVPSIVAFATRVGGRAS
jgi:hypothetical protein